MKRTSKILDKIETIHILVLCYDFCPIIVTCDYLIFTPSSIFEFLMADSISLY